MFFSVNALVYDAAPGLKARLLDNNRLSHVTRNGMLVVRLPGSDNLSQAAYPAEWCDVRSGESRSFGFRPDFSGGTVHQVHRFPEELADVPYVLKLEASEAHSRGSYCQVITGHGGERIRPYRRESDRMSMGRYVHPSTSVFSAPELGMVRLDANRARQQGFLFIRRAKVEVIDGLVVMGVEQLFRLNNPRLATTRFDQLPEELSAWRPALLAHYERWECDAELRCDGHYHLD